MTCPIYAYYYSVILVAIPDILSTSLVYLVTLPDTCYTSCGDTLFMYTYTLHFMYFVSCIPCRYNHNTIV